MASRVSSQRKSDGLRLDAYTEYVGKKMSFKDDEQKMLFEILADKCLTRIDHRYAMISGSLLDIPTLPKETLQEIYYIIASIASEESTNEKPRTVVEKSQLGDLDIEWGQQWKEVSYFQPNIAKKHRTHQIERKSGLRNILMAP